MNKTRRTLFIEELHLNILFPQGMRNLIKDIVPYDFYIYFYLAQWHYYFYENVTCGKHFSETFHTICILLIKKKSYL